MNSLVILYHRQPFAELKEGDSVKLVDHQSPNGILPSLRGFFRHVPSGTWIAWKEKKGDEPFVEKMQAPDNANYTVLRIPLTQEEIHDFYHVTSKEAFWPLLHSFPGYHSSNRANWENFVAINKRFAQATAEEADDDTIVWVHDYNLWLAPYWIRQLKPKAKIAFFHHTPFPSSDIFNIIPWSHEILESLLSCDLVGFHIPRYAENFVRTAKGLEDVKILERKPVEGTFAPRGSALAEPEATQKLLYRGRHVRIDAFPVGIDPEVIETIKRTEIHRARVGRISEELHGRKMLFSVGRVDYVKGTLELLRAFERLLERRGDLHEKIKLVVGTAPAAKGMEVYTATQNEIEQRVGAINGRFAKLDWIPVTLYARLIPFDEIVAYYECADVCLVTPLRDGLNLVAKEYIATKRGLGGVLVLSEFTGAAVELQDAVLVNPYAVESMDRAIETSIDMPQKEAKERMGRLYEHITRFTLKRWGDHVFEEFTGLGKNGYGKRVVA
jgi:glucosylglycerol-phosphate synthase